MDGDECSALINSLQQDPSEFYQLLTEIKFSAGLVPCIHELITSGIVRKDLVYLSLLLNEDGLRSLLEHESSLPLDITSTTSLFTELCKGRFWFEQILIDDFNLAAFNGENCRNTWLVRLVNCTNSPEIDVEKVERCLSEITEVNDEFVKTYIADIKYILQLVAFIQLNNDSTNLFNVVSTNSLLKVFNDQLDLTLEAKWGSILEKLKENDLRKSIFEYNIQQDTPSELDTFKMYKIVFKVVRSIQNESGIITDDHSLPAALQIQVLQDVFALCFLRTTNLNEQAADAFLCSNQAVRTILFYLKARTEKIKLNRDDRLYEKLKELNRYITDAFWRLETLTEINRSNDGNFMSYMLAEPASLIKLCLKADKFDKAHQVIQIFNLNESDLSREILHTESLNDLRAKLLKSIKIKEYQKIVPQMSRSITTTSTVEIFEELFREIEDESLKFRDVFDIALTLGSNHAHISELLSIADKYFSNNQYLKDRTGFYETITELHNTLGAKNNLTLSTLLSEVDFNLDLNLHETNANLYRNFFSGLELFEAQLLHKPKGTLMHKHAVHSTYLKLNDYLNGDTKYLLRLFNYLKSLAQIFYIEGNNSDLISRGRSVSYFEILSVSRAEIFGKLIFDRNLDPQDFENIATKLKIDLLYHTATNCFPQIKLNGPPSSQPLQKPSRSVFSYIQRRNWLLAFIVGEIFDLQETGMEISENRTKYLSRYINSNEIEHLKVVFGNNKTITSLHNDYVEQCIDYLNNNVFQDKDLENDSLESAEEILEDYSCNWRYLLDLLESIPESQRKEHGGFDKIKDRVLTNLVIDNLEPFEDYKYVQLIKNQELRLDVVFEHFSGWPGDFCELLLKSELLKGESKWRSVIVDWLKVIEFCEELRTLFMVKNWFEMHELCCENQEVVLEKLLMSNPKVNLLLSYVNLYKTEQLLQATITIDYIKLAFNSKQPLELIEQLFSKIPRPQLLQFCQSLLNSLHDIDNLQFILNYLKEFSDETFKNIQISLDILRSFGPNERDQLLSLIHRPLDILEMLIMNTKLDKFHAIMEQITPSLANCELNDDEISLESIDELLRQYAEKSLEFRVILQPHPKLLQDSDNKLMQSLDSLYGPDRKFFVMPPTIPSREEWVPNNEVVECMCCQNTIFSMFNRRHHCRRCGRVICFNCSTRRMHVPTYGDILVRVCIDCYDQSHSDGSSMGDNASSKSIIYDYWLLTNDQEHNAIVRQEFSYEHAPSVSLCLSIMKHHSKTDNYPKFLLKQCKNMMTLLQPIAPNGPQEIDYSLVIKMLKSLVIAAKMVSSECHPHYGTAVADSILSQADLLGLLAERGCLNLLQTPSPNEVPYVDAATLRRLRDKLLEKEQWNFALDVSTKAGLDNAGVFAAWGKSYLRAGCLQLAREKFQRCLDKTNYYDSTDDRDDEEPRRRTSKLSMSRDLKQTKNPPLLTQIVQILESQTVKFDGKTIRDMAEEIGGSRTASNLSLNKGPNVTFQRKSAVCIRNKLRNLRSVAAGIYESNEPPDNRLDPLFFDECVFYLNKYGTNLSLLQFYIRHGCMHEALRYFTVNQVPSDVFIEIYMLCLKDGKINILQEKMASIDSTLEVWKDYLKQICRFLEKQGLLNSLYQLQQFMGDFVRAAMTCIRFYKDNCSSYRELLSNIHYLYTAEEHLRQELEQQQWVEVNTDSKSNLEEKSLTNPSLVLKMDHRDITKNINTIKRQIEVTKFLADHEKNDKYLLNVLPNIAPSMNEEIKEHTILQMPTLFDSQHEKMQLAVLTLICGNNVEDGYGTTYQIIQDHKLKPIKVYCQAGKQLAREGDYTKVAQLVGCIRSSGDNNSAVTDMCDELLALAVRTLSTTSTSTSELETLIKLITDRNIKISMYIETKQLKSAYLLAVRFNRFGDIRRILREAELLNKPDIKKLCQKLLQSHSHSHKD